MAPPGGRSPLGRKGMGGMGAFRGGRRMHPGVAAWMSRARAPLSRRIGRGGRSGDTPCPSPPPSSRHRAPGPGSVQTKLWGAGVGEGEAAAGPPLPNFPSAPAPSPGGMPLAAENTPPAPEAPGCWKRRQGPKKPPRCPPLRSTCASCAVSRAGSGRFPPPWSLPCSHGPGACSCRPSIPSSSPEAGAHTVAFPPAKPPLLPPNPPAVCGTHGFLRPGKHSGPQPNATSPISAPSTRLACPPH